MINSQFSVCDHDNQQHEHEHERENEHEHEHGVCDQEDENVNES